MLSPPREPRTSALQQNCGFVTLSHVAARFPMGVAADPETELAFCAISRLVSFSVKGMQSTLVGPTTLTPPFCYPRSISKRGDGVHLGCCHYLIPLFDTWPTRSGRPLAIGHRQNT